MHNTHTIFQSIASKILSSKNELNIYGANYKQWMYIFKQIYDDKNNNLCTKSQLIVLPDQEMAEQTYEILSSLNLKNHPIQLQGLETSPYSSVVPSVSNMQKRFGILSHLVNNNKANIIITTAESLVLSTPPVDYFLNNKLTLNISDIIAPHDLALKLIELGYRPSVTVEEPGTFSKKGEIFDIFPTYGRPIRINYFDDMIEEFKFIDLKTNKTVKDQCQETIFIYTSVGNLTSDTFIKNFKNTIKNPGLRSKKKYDRRLEIFQSLNNNCLFETFPNMIPAFFETTSNLLDFFNNNNYIITLINEVELKQSILELKESLRMRHEELQNDNDSSDIVLSPEKIFNFNLLEQSNHSLAINVNAVKVITESTKNYSEEILLKLEGVSTFLAPSKKPTIDKTDQIKSSLDYIVNEFIESGLITISTYDEQSRDELIFFLEGIPNFIYLKNRVNFLYSKLDEGFYYKKENHLVLTASDLFAKKQIKTKRIVESNIDLFAEQFSTLVSGDFIIHNKHGVGKYCGIETMSLDNKDSDYIVIEYANQDKIYVPVYRMNLIQKYSDSSNVTKIANLRSQKFGQAKERAKNSIKKLAFNLLKLQAQRETEQAYAFSSPCHLYQEFELEFPFMETKDQRTTTDRVLQEMQKNTPMDHLVCGDVGFGKTEIAMRAAFKAVLDKKQVVLLAPTTILTLQHFNSFLARFKNFPVNIEFLSRFKTAKEAKEIQKEIELGNIDIIIGTHKVLSKDIKYFDLGLIIVDEEQRFGVAHKEKLKLLKHAVDCLTLTATPIPRTMQLAFLGLRELSLIKTAPPKRQSIKSYVLFEDSKTIQNAIQKELSRGGQVFIVHNRVNSIVEYTEKIQDLVPFAKITYAHGQMREKELEQKIQDFYLGKYQILIATTIIESGIDIPNANTMIVDRADTFGLSQLHQLRGRIGRSDKKAYAYFIIPHNKNITEIAEKRLKALQVYTELGSGFAIASSDLEIRGAGEILGGTQSGHLEEIGLELYMELLQDAINELKGEKSKKNKNIEVSAHFSCKIPSKYIKDHSERLKQYKRLSNCGSADGLDEIKNDLINIYGKLPSTLENLYYVLKTRVFLQELCIKSVNVGINSISFNFDPAELDLNINLRNKLIDTFLGMRKTYQFTPDYKLIHRPKNQINPEFLMNFAKEIAQKIVPC
ncbi:MAG: transcription-repair coupling factor [Bdellovibrionales bacterium]|nr:transcription-repair coupling factor [Bdellovibrionales bacterium]